MPPSFLLSQCTSVTDDNLTTYFDNRQTLQYRCNVWQKVAVRMLVKSLCSSISLYCFTLLLRYNNKCVYRKCVCMMSLMADCIAVQCLKETRKNFGWPHVRSQNETVGLNGFTLQALSVCAFSFRACGNSWRLGLAMTPSASEDWQLMAQLHTLCLVKTLVIFFIIVVVICWSMILCWWFGVVSSMYVYLYICIVNITSLSPPIWRPCFLGSWLCGLEQSAAWPVVHGVDIFSWHFQEKIKVTFLQN